MKLASRPAWSRGLFISYYKFTMPGLDAFPQGHSSIICVDGFDLRQPLSQQLPLDRVTACKSAAGRGNRTRPCARAGPASLNKVMGRPLIVVAVPLDEPAALDRIRTYDQSICGHCSGKTET